MAGHVEDPGHGIAEPEFLALAHFHVDPRNARCVGPGSDNGTAGFRLEPSVTAHMVAVMMGVENMGQRQPLLPQRRERRLRLGRVYRGAGSAFLLMKEIHIVVRENGYLMDVEHEGP